MLRFVGFFGSQLRGALSYTPIDEREGYDNLRKQYAQIRYFLKIPFPEKLSDEEFVEIREGLRWIRNELAGKETTEED